IYLWDTETDRQRATLRGHQQGEIGVTFAAGGNILASCAWDGTTRLWDPWAGRELVRLPGMLRAVSRDGRRLAVSPGWNNYAFWEVVPGHEYRSLPRRHDADKKGVGYGGFSPYGHLLGVGSPAGAHLWDLIS